ncbi:ECF RNA polymerase sigma factor SigG [Streptomyces sp. RB5]|uniref:RNA polymerase sigma factor n=1 Tax=Streptomyces smaragdinus TaxID=2585196 RepID=A0A7K0CR32_9ACTN|nr:sigma-70 family RNA polymerase sigma factor [Streptomyces smaragdinus]MQY15945.1 ECF RNA polymerase sigma factor SigG [Streptomyces smaragdinus]
MADRDDFARVADPYRGELLAHCYRMLGSVHDAEDLVQDTYVRAWRAFDRFEGRSSVRAWLYRIATRACLTALERRGRRPLPSGLGAPGAYPERGPGPAADAVEWLEPFPGPFRGPFPGSYDPAAAVAERESVRLAFVAALQHLPARQRAVLLLREVLGWTAAETAELLDTSSPAVNSALQRARDRLRAVAPREDATAPGLDDRTAQGFLDRYVEAFEKADVAGLVELLREDVVMEMPPVPVWFRGRADVAVFLASHVHRFGPGFFRLVPVVANGQPAYGTYARAADGSYHADALQVVDLTAGGIARVTAFRRPVPFARFGLPERLDS